MDAARGMLNLGPGGSGQVSLVSQHQRREHILLDAAAELRHEHIGLPMSRSSPGRRLEAVQGHAASMEMARADDDIVEHEAGRVQLEANALGGKGHCTAEMQRFCDAHNTQHP